MSDIVEAIQKLSQEQREHIKKKLVEYMEEAIKEAQDPKNKPQSLRQFIPYTEEAWKEEALRKKKGKR